MIQSAGALAVEAIEKVAPTVSAAINQHLDEAKSDPKTPPRSGL